MKVIKDAMMKWLEDEIGLADYNGEMCRKEVLEEVKSKMSEVIAEEFHKLSESKDA